MVMPCRPAMHDMVYDVWNAQWILDCVGLHWLHATNPYQCLMPSSTLSHVCCSSSLSRNSHPPSHTLNWLSDVKFGLVWIVICKWNCLPINDDHRKGFKVIVTNYGISLGSILWVLITFETYSQIKSNQIPIATTNNQETWLLQSRPKRPCYEQGLRANCPRSSTGDQGAMLLKASGTQTSSPFPSSSPWLVEKVTR